MKLSLISSATLAALLAACGNAGSQLVEFPVENVVDAGDGSTDAMHTEDAQDGNQVDAPFTDGGKVTDSAGDVANDSGEGQDADAAPGPDAKSDAPVMNDAGEDAATDAGEPDSDNEPDGRTDAGDSGRSGDSGPQTDGGSDAREDVGPVPDAGHDAAPDAGNDSSVNPEPDCGLTCEQKYDDCTATCTKEHGTAACTELTQCLYKCTCDLQQCDTDSH